MMTKLEEILERYPDEELLKADGLDEAIIGTAELKQTGDIVLVYSRSAVIRILMQRDEMTEEDAQEYYDYNIVGAYMGKKTPIWVEDEFLY